MRRKTMDFALELQRAFWDTADTALAVRFLEAAETLDAMADAERSERLRGKAEGVRLALSYLEERMREERHNDGSDLDPDEPYGVDDGEPIPTADTDGLIARNDGAECAST